MRLKLENMRFRHYSILVASMLLAGFLASCKQEEPEPVPTYGDYCSFYIWNTSTHPLYITIHSQNSISLFWNSDVESAYHIAPNPTMNFNPYWAAYSKEFFIGFGGNYSCIADIDTVAQDLLPTILGDSISLMCDSTLIAVWKPTDISANNIYSLQSWGGLERKYSDLYEVNHHAAYYIHYPITQAYVDSLLELTNIHD